MDLLRRLFVLLFAALTALPVIAQSNRSLNEHRVALIVGNAAYKSSPLRNPINDARAMRDKLREMGFQVIYFEDLRTRQVGAAIREFRTAIRPGSVALFFYAGHGLQVRGENYLPTVDADLSSEDDVPQQSMAVSAVLNAMEDSKAAVNLVLLDACRNNPFARNFRSAPTGLARVQAPSGTLIHYATRPGAIADDGAGRHGMYTEALLAHIGERGVPIETALKRVTIRVRETSKGKQEPWMEGSLTGDFYFVVSPGATVNVQPSLPTPANADEAAWQAAESVRTASAYQAYLTEFPRGLFAAAARVKLAAMQGGGVAAAPAAPAVTVSKTAAGKVTVTPAATAAAAVAPALPAMATATATATPAPAAAPAARDSEAAVTLQYALREMSLARIGGNTFQMGADADEPGFDGQPDASAQPKRGVMVTNFELAYYETQVYQWKKFIEATRYVTEAERSGGCHVPSKGASFELRANVNWRNPGYAQTDYHPVVCVSYNDVVAYLQWLNSGSSVVYRLPSEAEWEFAARGGTTTPRPWAEQAGFFGKLWEGTRDTFRSGGNRTDQPPSRSCRYANVADEALDKQLGWPGAFNCRDSYPYATGGGWFGRDNLSLYDMLGNAAEWVEDCWAPNHEAAPNDASPRLNGPTVDCTRRVVRGGSWASPQAQVRSAARLSQPASYRASDLSFRLARNPQ
ncbi:MAG: SUMF1/EgtB/PvdO family nonheme iron enzyme [Rubrivivax sp.]|jgi:formylglycine-generating enzyme required for sulfatase activity|nr:SUMF1/EgtB/PvdO family nonheme iron enzyme [Rubrivivax sp.]